MIKWLKEHVKRNRTTYVFVYMLLKASFPQEANCPTLENKLDIKSYEKNIDYPNTTNIKKVANFYDSCRENYF